MAILAFGGCEFRSQPSDVLGVRERGPANITVTSQAAQPSLADFGRESPLPLPSTLSVHEYEKSLFEFLDQRDYVSLGWRKDKSVRDTGPFIDGVYYGTHPAVRVYYSPGIISWLKSGRLGPIPDGEMIIKEQYPPPAARHRGKSEEELRDSLESWTVMVKDSAGSHDGWFWSNPGADAKPFDYHAENQKPYSGFGLYCIRCHASTQSPAARTADAPDNEFTFASLRNIEGFPGEPIIFRVDDSWRDSNDEGTSESQDESPSVAGNEVNQAFAKLYDAITATDLDRIACLPASSHDSVPASRDKAYAFMTSNQCMNCHAGLTGPLGQVGFFHKDAGDTAYGSPGVNVSPYGEWRWTPMGLAGRDPVFYAQLESEVALIEKQFGEGTEANTLAETLVDTCFRCHGAMGHQQLHASATHDALMKLEDVDSHSPIAALAREGVSCMVCHRMQPLAQPADDERPYLEHFLQTSITGNLHFGPSKEIYGPYQDQEISGYAMQHATGQTPRHSDYIRQSRLCGTCHTVSLPTIDHPLAPGEVSDADIQLTQSESVPAFRKFHHHLEQATYLEWLNSQYNNETDPSSVQGQSCQDCHMPDQVFADENGAADAKIRTRIAAIQDDTYPDAENLADHQSLHVRVRDEYRRHGFAGLNIWLLELFRQFSDELGVKSQDYMTGSDSGAEQAIDGMKRMAQTQTATLNVDAKLSETPEGNFVEADVRVTNLAGHRFPTGVGFRRAFIEFLVVQTDQTEDQQVLWSSGRTNELGVILGGDGKPLPTEFFDLEATDETHQPHHQTITSSDQVQIYETLLQDNFGRFTTSFVRGCETVKDNRLLPKGWSKLGPGNGLTGAYLAATQPGPLTMSDSDFIDGSGSDTVRYRVALPQDADLEHLEVIANLYYQATPPYYLDNLFKTAPDGEATQRLHALASRLKLSDTAVAQWKLPIANARSVVERH